ncbi:adenylosuccinate lyase, partial [Patescibacteria group bacterium]|nr:adenylosuccinate lyase [Patescibacteria group bacterium]MBU1967421.1 adenylosuccinate lyase [Patescibacteria group bacterium]
MKNKILSNFLAITPLDGRNYHKIPFLSDYFSEFALNKQRLAIEIKYLIFLSQQNIAPKLSFAQQRRLAQLVQNFDLTQMKKINLIEKKLNHETKAVEYYLKSEL